MQTVLGLLWSTGMRPNEVASLKYKDFDIENNASSIDRKGGDLCIASYLNFLIVNGGVIVPQYGDENDALALSQIQEMFPDRKVVGVMTREIVYGGGNIHCITQQQPCPVR